MYLKLLLFPPDREFLLFFVFVHEYSMLWLFSLPIYLSFV